MLKGIVFIYSGDFRRKVFLSLLEPRTPAMLKRKLNAHRSSVSRALSELKKARLVKASKHPRPNCVFYEMTAQGVSVLKKMKKLGL